MSKQIRKASLAFSGRGLWQCAGPRAACVRVRALKKSLGVLAACAVGVGAAGGAIQSASAAVIYSDTFTAVPPNPPDLNGLMPGVDATGGAWTAPIGAFSTGNGFATVKAEATSTTAGGGYTAYLPLTLAPNTLYTLTATLTPNAGSSADWLAMGFGSATTDPAYNAGVEQAWLIYRNTGEADSEQNGTVNSQKGGTAAPFGADKFTITLNSVTGAVTYADKLGLLANNNPVAVSNISAVNAVFIGSFQTASGTFQSFQLSATPRPLSAPGSLCCASMGLLGLGLMRRRRKCGMAGAKSPLFL